jgi:hypothetical protein
MKILLFLLTFPAFAIPVPTIHQNQDISVFCLLSGQDKPIFGPEEFNEYFKLKEVEKVKYLNMKMAEQCGKDFKWEMEK